MHTWLQNNYFFYLYFISDVIFVKPVIKKYWLVFFVDRRYSYWFINHRLIPPWWADDQHRPAMLEHRFVPDLPLPKIPTTIDLRVIDLVSSTVWWEAEIKPDTTIIRIVVALKPRNVRLNSSQFRYQLSFSNSLGLMCLVVTRKAT